MDRSRWGCLLVVVLYVVVAMVFPLSGDEPAAEPNDARLPNVQFAAGLLLTLGFVCVWWSEILGDALWMGHGAWNPIPSTSGVVRLLGWMFLIGAFMIHATFRHRAIA